MNKQNRNKDKEKKDKIKTYKTLWRSKMETQYTC